MKKFQNILFILVLTLMLISSATAGLAADSATDLPNGFVYLDEVLTGIEWDVRYSQADNFTGAPLPGYEANRVVISRAMIEPLRRARDAAAVHGYKLLIWDAARPQRAVDRFVAWSLEPENYQTKERYYPAFDDKRKLFEEGYIARRSGHSRGNAIDLTLTDMQGKQLDMGGAFDFFGRVSNHGAAGLNEQQQSNRAVFVEIMTGAGFTTLEEEWWHYILINEPFPGQYFDFVIREK